MTFFSLVSCRLKFWEDKDYLWDWILLLSWLIHCRLCSLRTLGSPNSSRHAQTRKPTCGSPMLFKRIHLQRQWHLEHHLWPRWFCCSGKLETHPAFDGSPRLAPLRELSAERSSRKMRWRLVKIRKLLWKKPLPALSFTVVQLAAGCGFFYLVSNAEREGRLGHFDL